MSTELIKVLFSFLGTGIFFVWIFWGQFVGIIILAVAVISNLAIAWCLGDYSLSLDIFLFLFIATIAHYLYSKMRIETRQTSIKIEDIQKNKNILEQDLSSHKGVQEALKRKLHRLFQLKELINNLSAHLDVEGVASVVANKTFNIISKADNCYFYIVDTQKQELALTAVKQKHSQTKVKNKTGDMFDHWTFKQRQPLLIEDVRKDYRFDLGKNIEGWDSSYRSLISAPLIGGRGIIGSIRLNSAKTNAFLPDDLRLLDIISNLAAVSLENTFLYNRTMELAITDSLTGIYVQKFFKERLSEEITRALRGSYNISILLLDIDYFKLYNDKYGHMAGDMVLKRVANILNQIAGDSGDIVARYGGEEFAAIFVNRTKEEAVGVAETIRKKIGDEIFFLRREETKLTVSIGVASFPQDAKISEDLIKIADDALYKAKKSGRNCVCIK